MADPVSSFATRVAYGATQLPRVAWYLGHGAVMRGLSDAQRRSGETQPRARPARSRAGTRLYAEMAKLFRQDLANVEAGLYPLPADHDGSWPILLNHSRLFFCLLYIQYAYPCTMFCIVPILNNIFVM